MSWIYLGKVGSARRVYLRNCGFSEGDTVLFLEKNGRVYLVKCDDIVGVATINSGRVKLPKKVSKMLNIGEDDYFGVIEDKKVAVNLSSNMRIVKVVRGEEDEGA